jgi:CO dehydrogenase maturation factor
MNDSQQWDLITEKQRRHWGQAMKIVICGKGGSGKSTISALLARALSRSGHKVLLIDADESNAGLHRLMGTESPRVMMDDLGGKKGFKEKNQSNFPGGKTEIFGESLTWDDLAGFCHSETPGPRLLSIGKIHDPGEGCACPMGSLSKMILSRLVLSDKELVIIDTSAGIEHFGRGIDSHCDLVLGVIDPSYESFILSEKMTQMAEKAGLRIYFILNKLSPEIKDLMRQKIPKNTVAAEIDTRNDIFLAGLQGHELPDMDSGIQTAADLILSIKTREVLDGLDN